MTSCSGDESWTRNRGMERDIRVSSRCDVGGCQVTAPGGAMGWGGSVILPHSPLITSTSQSE